MSEVEKELLIERTKALNEEEQRVIVKYLPNEVLMNEIASRLATYDVLARHIGALSNTLKGELPYEKQTEIFR